MVAYMAQYWPDTMSTINIVLRMLNLWTTKLGSVPVSSCSDKPCWLSISQGV